MSKPPFTKLFMYSQEFIRDWREAIDDMVKRSNIKINMINNYQDKPLSEFKPGDTLYLRINTMCQQVDVLVKFINFNGVAVESEFVSVDAIEYEDPKLSPDYEAIVKYVSSVNPIMHYANKFFLVFDQSFCFFNADGTMPVNCKEK